MWENAFSGCFEHSFSGLYFDVVSSLNLLLVVPFLACLAWFAGLAGLPWLALLACLALLAGGARRVRIDSRNCSRTLAPRSASGFEIGICCLGSLAESVFRICFQNEL